ncbi:MAG: CapA family protein, partial [Thiohalobacterales bacterium]|nr:CapA family protein [Thiohalobacterales bacterium]
ILVRPDGGRVLVFAGGLQSSGIPPQWAATPKRPGVNFLRDLSARTAGDIAAAVEIHKRPGDVVVVSLHWGGNWGYDIPAAHRRFARELIDEADVDLVHGHSSHHPLGLEVYRGRPILYGCGDLIDDYEGIRRYEQYRIELALLYLVTLDRQRGELVSLDMVPMRRQRFRLERASPEETDWLAKTLDRECRLLGTQVIRTGEGTLRLAWEGQ